MRNTGTEWKYGNVGSRDNMVTNEQLRPMNNRDFLMNIEVTYNWIFFSRPIKSWLDYIALIKICL